MILFLILCIIVPEIVNVRFTLFPNLFLLAKGGNWAMEVGCQFASSSDDGDLLSTCQRIAIGIVFCLDSRSLMKQCKMKMKMGLKSQLPRLQKKFRCIKLGLLVPGSHGPCHRRIQVIEAHAKIEKLTKSRVSQL